MSEKEDEGGIDISGYAVLTVSVKMELHQYEGDWHQPTVVQHRLQTVIPDPAVGRGMNPDRFMSAGQVFGHELGRVANHFRDWLADHEEMADGFAREMRDWAVDHGKVSEIGEWAKQIKEDSDG
jgi:hypothetical protein